MLCRFLFLLLPVALLVQCAPAGMVATEQGAGRAIIQKEAEPLVSSREQLSTALQDWIHRAQNPVNFRLSAALRPGWRQYVGESVWGEYARRCSARYVEETGQVSLNLEYRDYVRLRAALRDASFRATLRPEEERVLKWVEDTARPLLQPGMSDFDKLLALHDALVQYGRYDAGAGGNVEELMRSGSGSCEAYSAALCVMLELAGIPSRLVTGDASGPHAWNMVKLGKDWYHVDATWNDPVLGNTGRQVVSHTYFCLNDAELARTHRWERSAYPACRAADCYYYRRQGRCFTSFDSYWQEAMRAWRSGAARFEGYLVTYGSPERFRTAMQRAMTDGTPAHISWTGPETEAGAVILSFEPQGGR